MSLESFPPLVLVSVRYVLSGAILVGFAVSRGLYLPRGRELAAVCFTGFLMVSVANGALVYAETLIPSGMAGLIITISPFWLVGLDAVMPGGESLRPATICGMLVGLAGAALLFAPDLQAGAAHRRMLWGFLVLQGSMAAWSFGTIYQKRKAGRAHPIVAGAVQQLVAGLIMALLAFAIRERPVVWSVRGVSALLYLVVFGSIVGYSAYAYAVDRLPVAIVSVYPYVNAIVAVSLGWLFYREPFGLRESVAIVVIFAGVGIVKRYSHKQPV